MSRTNSNLVDERAAEHTLALNPLVGLTMEELLGAARSVCFQAFRHPLSILRAGTGYTGKLVNIALGRERYEPESGDRRFADAAWRDSWLFEALLQAYLALGESIDEWVDDAEFDELNVRRARFIAQIIKESMSPTNLLLTNPAALKRIIDTGGKSLLTGLTHLVEDQWSNGGMPLQVDKSKFQVGENIAATPGAVIFRNEMLELIQYTPTTDKVHRRPLLFIPPQINKYYAFDLSPEKSFFRYCVSEGLQTFTISWRNPRPEHADWGIDDYIRALKEATEVLQAVTGSKTINICAPCSGGITAMILAGHLKALGQDVIHSMTIPVCVLVQEKTDNDLALFASDSAIELARANSRRQGVLRGRQLAKAFSWMRPNDLIWGYVVNNYLMGNNPPAFDILYWNNDTTNLPAQLHSDFLDIVGANALGRPGDLSVCDTEIDLRSVESDLFVLGGLTDHLTPWEACYRTTQLTGGKAEFVLAASGHIQSLVSAIDNPKARYFMNPGTADTPSEWLADAVEHAGSWWPTWSAWVRERSGTQKKAPGRPGSNIHPQLCDAPGTYIREPAV